MDLSALIPTPDSIPVHWGWLKLFLMLTFMIHLLLMNVMTGTGFIALFTRAKTGNSSDELQKTVSYSLPFIIAFTVNFGVAPLLFLQTLYGQFMYVSSVLMAVWWLSVVGLMIVAYYSAYYCKFNFDRLKEKRIFFIGTATAIFTVVGFLFTNNMTMMLIPETWLKYFDNPHGTILNLTEPSLIPRFLHFMTASVAIGGLSIAIFYYLKKKKGIPDTANNIERGMKWFSYATMLQIIIGFWFQMSLPKAVTLLFVGGSSTHTLIFLISLALTVAVLFFGMRQHVWITAALTSGLVFSMILIRDMVRTAYLKPFFSLSDLTVTGQYSPLALFLLSLAAGAAAVIYVIRLAIKSARSETA